MERSVTLVTGGAGYIGSHVCKALSQRGILPVTYDNLCSGHGEAVQWGPLEIDLARVSAVVPRSLWLCGPEECADLVAWLRGQARIPEQRQEKAA